MRHGMPTGVAAVDELLNGGVPAGAITEMVGPESCGRTSLALSCLAQAMQKGHICAWIDACDALNVESAAAAGLDLSRLLWVRCGIVATARQIRNPQFTLPEKRFTLPVQERPRGRGFRPHSDEEKKVFSDAVGNFLRPKTTMPDRAQVQAWRVSERESRDPNLRASRKKPSLCTGTGKLWKRIEQALEAVDLLLQSGGFSVIVLDMAGVPPEYVSRIELSIWFRYRAAAERTQASLLLLTQHACAKSAGELLLRFLPACARRDEKTVFTGIEHSLEVQRQRFSPSTPNVVILKKTSQRETRASWQTQSTWTAAR